MGKTFKDVMKQDIKTHKKIAREEFKDQDLRTRVKPVQKKERGGGNNWRNEIDKFIEDEFDIEDQAMLEHIFGDEY